MLKIPPRSNRDILKHTHAEIFDLRTLLIFSLILLLGICIGIQGMAPAQSAGTPVENMRTGLTYSTIQAAIDDATTIAGDTIQVSSGTYHENVVIDKSIVLKGVNTGNGLPVVDGSGSNIAITISASGVTLQGFTATDATYGIYVMSNNNIITGNTANSNNNDGIILHSANNNRVTGNTASYNNGNTSRTDDVGIYLENSNNNVVTNNTANYNNYGSGIKLDGSNNNTVSGNTANNNFLKYNINYDFGIYLWGSSNNNVTGNTANGNNYGIFLDGWGNAGSNYNGISGNTADNNYYGILIDDSFHNTAKGNTANNNNIDGILLQDSSEYNNIVDNTATGNDNNGEPGGGICFDQSFDNVATGNIANSNGQDGFFLMDSSSNNNLTGNTANNNNNYGIGLTDASNNIIVGNTINNNAFGVYLTGSNGNDFWLNILQGNRFENAVVADGSSNNWNSPTKLQYTYNGQSYTNYNGNYWSDGQWAGQTNGIENTAYTINSNNIDHYPMVLAGSPITPSPTASPTVTPTPTPSPGSIVVNLNTGWNLIGWCSSKSSDASTVLKAIPGNQVIDRYDAATGRFYPYDETSSPAKDNFVIQPGMGYFIGSDTPQTLNFGAF